MPLCCSLRRRMRAWRNASAMETLVRLRPSHSLGTNGSPNRSALRRRIPSTTFQILSSFAVDATRFCCSRLRRRRLRNLKTTPRGAGQRRLPVKSPREPSIADRCGPAAAPVVLAPAQPLRVQGPPEFGLGDVDRLGSPGQGPSDLQVCEAAQSYSS